jgi:hypothetical protein
MRWKHAPAVVAAIATLGMAAVLEAQPAPAQGAGGGQADHVAALTQAMKQGMALARKYEWVETTIISLKGEEKSRKQSRCYYGADGKVQKVSLDQAQPAQDQGGGRAGRRGGGRLKEKIVENKKDEMKAYMEKAAALIHAYVPPDPQQVQAAKAAGRIATNPQAGGAVRLVISQYLKPGDSLSIDLDPKAGRVLGLGVTSYLDTNDDVVTLAVQMNALPDGAIFAGQTTLEAKAKNITVVIQNSGHRPVQQ